MRSISVVVPAFNEEKNISRTLQILRDSKLFKEIICVDDGSEDSTNTLIDEFPQVKKITLDKNRGKGYALAEGIKRAKSDLMMLLDADLTLLNKDHLLQLLDPIMHHKGIDVVVAYENGKFISIFSGQRVYHKHDLDEYLDKMRETRYGVEVLLNAAFRNRTVKYIQLENLGHIDKFSKFNKFVWFYNYFVQWFVMVLGQVMKYGITKNEFKAVLEEQASILVEKFKEYYGKNKRST